jgi:hypothetical protein
MAKYYKKESLLGLFKRLNGSNPSVAPACHLNCTRNPNGDISGEDNGVCEFLNSW